jgi:syntaxin 1B/2/3
MSAPSRLSALKGIRSESTHEVAVEMEAVKQQPSALDEDCGKPFQVVKESMNAIEKNSDRIRALKNRADVEIKDSEQKEIMNELDKLMILTKKEASKTKEALSRLETENKEFEKKNPGSTQSMIRANLLSSHTKQFNTVMRDFQEASEEFRDSLKQRIGRQARIVKENITEKEIEQIIASEDPGKFMREAMGLSDVLVDAVAELEERHERMRRIEQGVREILELFQDLATLVEVQQEHLDNIEQNVASAKNYTQEGEKELVKVEQSQKKARKWQCYLLIVVLIIVIGLIIYFTAR